MSDHIDGPRSIGDPSIDLTDLFAFISPENPGAHRVRRGRVSVGRQQRDVQRCRDPRDRRAPA